jgi:hypothetical protein
MMLKICSGDVTTAQQPWGILNIMQHAR